MNERNKREYEFLRMNCYYSVLPHLKNNTDIKEFMPFGWDATKIESETLTKEDVKNRINQIMKQII